MVTDAASSPGDNKETHRVLAAFAAVNALSAWGGAVALVVGAIDFGTEINQRLPLESTVLAGCLLAAVVAVPSSVLAWQAWTGRGDVGLTAMLVGVALMGWIVGQLAVIQSISWLQPAFLIVGLLIWRGGNAINRA